MMKISDHVRQKAFGYEFNYRLYIPQSGSRNYLICFHGIGECGPADGSELNKVAVHGYPKLAQKGAEFPFNIIAPQVVSSYSTLKKFILPYIKLKYGAEKIIVTGLSMGGFATWEIVLQDEFNFIDAIAPVCGKMSTSLAANYPEIDAWAFHGDKDPIVSYSADKAFIDTYNKTHTKQIKLSTYAGVAHDAWNYAYRLDNDYDNPNLYLWLLEKFSDG